MVEGIDLPLANEEILSKWRMLAGEALKRIESIILRLEECKDMALLGELMVRSTKNPIA